MLWPPHTPRRRCLARCYRGSCGGSAVLSDRVYVAHRSRLRFRRRGGYVAGPDRRKQTYTINGNRFTTGVLRANRVVIVLSGVSMINATMTTQLLLDHFRIERLIMSGIAGGVNPAHQVGDITVPDRWTMPMEVYWHHDA